MPMSAAMEEAQRFLDLCYKSKDRFNLESRQIAMITEMISYSKRFCRKFSAKGFFVINKTIVFNFSGLIATYVIITMQFNESQFEQMNKNLN